MTDHRLKALSDEEVDERNEDDWAGYRLGDPIELADFLALPADYEAAERRLDRDDRGRLCPMLPDDQEFHRLPMMCIDEHVRDCMERRYKIAVEPYVALPSFSNLSGAPIPTSRLGLQTIRPDLVIFDGFPRYTPVPARGRRGFTIDGVRIFIEILSDDTFRSDLGLGRADKVDRWKSYLDSKIPELWILNLGVGRPCPVPPRSGLFLKNAGSGWEALPVDRPVHTTDEVHGIRPLTGGTVRSLATGATIDLEVFWKALTPSA